MRDEVAPRAAMSIDFKNNRIRIHKNTLHLIGNPEYILFLVNPIENTIAIMQGDSSDPRARRIAFTSTAGEKSSVLCSKLLVQGLQSIHSEWQDNRTYRLYGELIEGRSIVKFCVKESVLIGENLENYYDRIPSSFTNSR